jgi:hydrogenase nickel incorporation protein HypA/HybF
MHELSICEAVLRQVLDLAPPPDATVVGRITLRVGPLAGVEPD